MNLLVAYRLVISVSETLLLDLVKVLQDNPQGIAGASIVEVVEMEILTSESSNCLTVE